MLDAEDGDAADRLAVCTVPMALWSPTVGAQSRVVPRRHILVVDNDAGIRETLAELLELEGYEVRQAENGLVALRMVAERRPALILLDLMMPVMSGWQVLERLHEDGELRTIPVLVLSAAGTPPANVMFLSKPCIIERLLEAVRGSCAPMEPGSAGEPH